MLAEASTLYSALDPRNRNPFEREPSSGPDREELIASFLDVDLPETSALLHVFAELTDDDLLRARIRRELSSRSHVLPDWITNLADAAPYRTLVMSHVLGDGDNVMIGVRLPGGGELTFVVYIDHNLGTVVKDAFVLPEPITDIAALMDEEHDDDPDFAISDLRSADARVRITEAIDRGAISFPPYETDSWPSCRPLVEWVTSLLPQGGRGYERPEWDDDARSELARRFLGSPFAVELGGDKDYADLLDTLLWFGCDYGPGDPLRWSPVAVEIVLTDWFPRKIVAPVTYLAKAPDVLRAIIRFAHDERGIRSSLTTETLDAVDRWEPEYQQLIRSDRPQGPMALLAAMGALDPEGADDLRGEAGATLLHPWRARLPDRRPRKSPPELAEEMKNSVIIRRLRSLTDFYGDGRKLTQTGNPTLADARSLIALLGTADKMDETIGDRTFKTASAAELPELMFTIRWGIAAGALRKEHGKLRATVKWRKLADKPDEQWMSVADAIPKMGPLVTFFAHSRYRGSSEIVDEIVDGILASLLPGPLDWKNALDIACEYADANFEWLAPYMQDPEHRRTSFSHDLDVMVMILGWAGIVDRVGATAVRNQWDPKRQDLAGGTLQLTAPGRWWLGS